MVIEEIVQYEISNINKGIVKKRVSLKNLLESPEIKEKGVKIDLDIKKLQEIADKTNLPTDSIFIPITFFIPSGSYEGYLMDKKDARIVEDLGYKIYERDGKYWISKYKIRKLIMEYRGIFQSIILP